jgi:dTDP-4-dehydrorhamnose 3,5-epimerase
VSALPAGVEVRDLAVFADERGAVRHFLRADAPHFQGFGEVYFSTVLPGRVKAWRRHRQATANFAVPVGRVRLALWDEASATLGTLELGADVYRLVTVPPGLWTGFLGLSAEPALIANCVSLPHDPAESDRRAPDDPAMPHVWPPA